MYFWSYPDLFIMPKMNVILPSLSGIPGSSLDLHLQKNRLWRRYTDLNNY